MKRNTRTFAALAALALAVAACGGASGGDEGAVDDAGGGATSVTVTGTEFAFDPVNVAIPANTDVTVTFNNGGTIEHEWTVIALGTKISSEAEFSEDLVVERLVAPGGGSDQAVLNLPAGEYQVICAIPGHLSAGMEGTLTVGG